MSAHAPILAGKRKRAVVSYKEHDNLVELESELDDKQPAVKTSWDDDGDSDDDEDFSTRRKKSTKKALPKKKARAVKQPPKEKSFRFLDLPAELRDMIYELTLTNAGAVGIVARQTRHRHIAVRGSVYTEGAYRRSYYGRRRFNWKSNPVNLAPISTTFVPALLAVNKQVNAEGINYLYGQDFIFEDTTALHSFLAPIGTRNLQRLENIEIMSWGRSGVSKGNNHAAFTLLAGATNLKSLRLRCDVSYWSNQPGRIANRVFGEAHWFLEAYGAANGRKDAAVDILEMDNSNFEQSGEDTEVRIQHFKKSLRALLGVRTSARSRK